MFYSTAFNWDFPTCPKKANINFVFPDSVEVTASEYVEKQKIKNPNTKYFCFLWYDSLSIYRLTILSYKRNEKTIVAKWIRSSNRYAVLNNEKLPLLLDYDFRFGTSDPENIGKYGERDGSVKKMNLIAHAFTVIFDNSTGRLLKIESQ
ncbi:MAG: hypothetical protein SFU21_04160 [Flavihumibacter sp.]|nr:hypothetical protein [Flavihumibacter sp.]